MSAALAQLKSEFVATLDGELVESIFVDMGHDPAKTREQLRLLVSSSHDEARATAERVATQFESDLAMALRMSSDSLAHTLLRASLASIEWDDVDDNNNESQNDENVNVGINVDDVDDDENDATSVSEILSNVDDDSVVAELLDLIATQTVVIEELREQNDAMQKRIAELQSGATATSTTATQTPIVAKTASAEPRPRVQTGKLTYKRTKKASPAAIGAAPVPVASSSAPRSQVDDLQFLRDLFRDEPTISDILLQRFYAESNRDVGDATNAALRWLNNPFFDADLQAIDALLAVDASDDVEEIDPYTSDLSRLFAGGDAQQPPRSLANKIKFDDLCKHFAQVDRTVLQSIFDMCDGDTRRTVETLRAAGMSSPAFPPPPAPNAAPKLTPGPTWRGSVAATKHIKPARQPPSNAFRSVPSKASAAPKKAAKPAAKRVSHVGVPQSPQDVQAQTRGLFEAQTKCLRGAAALRGAGKYAEASALMQQAREFQQRRQQCARRFFASQFALQSGSTTIDLHGQTVAEALQLVRETIDLCRQQRKQSEEPHYLSIITGVGRNSPGGVARIRPAVERLLEETGLQYRTTNGGGCFVIKL
jgi:DNA-nicking Smr family endonuclease/chaperonin cofactor prefoldin